MPVPTYQRKESKIEFLSKAVDLCRFVAQLCTDKFSKKFTFYGINDFYQLANKVAENCIKANSYNLYEYYKEREFLLTEALATLDCLSIKTTLVKEYENKVTDKQWVKLGLDIGDLKALIKALMKSDKERFEKK